ncbi:MAG: hypothetical protein U5K69_27500 [Balneolaceae bacterium]|nr:hypothetical protein [Balneolaceae bacterium]
MAYIDIEEGLPGIMGLLEFRQDTAKPIRKLTQVLLRGPSPLNEGERELIAALGSHRNNCTFCSSAHTATADLLIAISEITAAVKRILTARQSAKK